MRKNKELVDVSNVPPNFPKVITWIQNLVILGSRMEDIQKI